MPQYLVEHSHPPIIDPEGFELVQAEIERRKGIGRAYSSNIFSARIVCACCGSFFGSKVWHSTSKYRRVIWQCNHKFSNGEKCTTPHLYEDEIRKGFVKVCKQVFTDKAEFIASCREIVALLSDCTALDAKIEEAYTSLDDLTTAMQEFIKENAMHPQDEDFYSNRLAEYDMQKSEAEKRLNELQSQKAARLSRKELLDGLIRSMEESDEIVTGFDENLWRLMVEKVTVGIDGKLTFTLRNGTEV